MTTSSAAARTFSGNPLPVRTLEVACEFRDAVWLCQPFTAPPRRRRCTDRMLLARMRRTVRARSAVAVSNQTALCRDAPAANQAAAVGATAAASGRPAKMTQMIRAPRLVDIGSRPDATFDPCTRAMKPSSGTVHQVPPNEQRII